MYIASSITHVILKVIYVRVGFGSGIETNQRVGEGEGEGEGEGDILYK